MEMMSLAINDLLFFFLKKKKKGVTTKYKLKGILAFFFLFLSHFFPLFYTLNQNDTTDILQI
jgi:hypothetical protein